MNQKVCPTCETILPDDPYRGATIHAFNGKSIGFVKKMYSMVKRSDIIKRIRGIKMFKSVGSFALNAVIGVVVLCLVGGALWCVFPGAFMLGLYVGHDVFGWHMPTIWDTTSTDFPPITWGFGLLVIAAPILLPFIGHAIRKNW